jgi:hypothetical protein
MLSQSSLRHRVLKLTGHDKMIRADKCLRLAILLKPTKLRLEVMSAGQRMVNKRKMI